MTKQYKPIRNLGSDTTWGSWSQHKKGTRKTSCENEELRNRNWDDEVCKDRELLPCLDERYMNECDVH